MVENLDVTFAQCQCYILILLRFRGIVPHDDTYNEELFIPMPHIQEAPTIPKSEHSCIFSVNYGYREAIKLERKSVSLKYMFLNYVYNHTFGGRPGSL